MQSRFCTVTHLLISYCVTRVNLRFRSKIAKIKFYEAKRYRNYIFISPYYVPIPTTVSVCPLLILCQEEENWPERSRKTRSAFCIEDTCTEGAVFHPGCNLIASKLSPLKLHTWWPSSERSIMWTNFGQTPLYREVSLYLSPIWIFATFFYLA